MVKVAWPDERLYKDWRLTLCTCDQQTVSAPTWRGGGGGAYVEGAGPELGPTILGE